MDLSAIAKHVTPKLNCMGAASESEARCNIMLPRDSGSSATLVTHVMYPRVPNGKMKYQQQHHVTAMVGPTVTLETDVMYSRALNGNIATLCGSIETSNRNVVPYCYTSNCHLS